MTDDLSDQTEDTSVENALKGQCVGMEAVQSRIILVPMKQLSNRKYMWYVYQMEEVKGGLKSGEWWCLSPPFAFHCWAGE